VYCLINVNVYISPGQVKPGQLTQPAVVLHSWVDPFLTSSSGSAQLGHWLHKVTRHFFCSAGREICRVILDVLICWSDWFL